MYGKGKGRRRDYDRGDRYSGGPGVIRERDAAASLGLVDVLNLVIEKYSRYTNELLDLSALREIEELRKHHPNLNRHLWCQVVARCIVQIQEKGTKVLALTLDANDIRDLHDLVSALSDADIQLDSLSLRDNRIEDIQGIHLLQRLRVQHLILMNNPIYKADEQKLLRALLKAVPSIRCIDSRMIDKTSALDRFPPQIAGFQETNEMHPPLLALVQKYFGVATAINSGQSNIAALLGCYVETATCTVTMQRNFTLGMAHEGQEYIRKLAQEAHNVLNAPTKETHRTVAQGHRGIASLLQKVHAVSVDFDCNDLLRKTDIIMLPPEGAAMTGCPFVPIVMVQMHMAATFKVKENRRGDSFVTVRRFCDRTWVLTSLQGSPVIISELIHFRDPGREKEPVYVPTTAAAGRSAFYSLHMCQDDAKVVELATVTGLHPEFARNCLEEPESGPWNLEKALLLFKRRQAEHVLQPQHFSGVTDKRMVSCKVFGDRTGLTLEAADMCLQVPQVQYDLWKAYSLFTECVRNGSLSREHFSAPA